MSSEEAAEVISSGQSPGIVSAAAPDNPSTADKIPEPMPARSLTAEERKARQKAAREAVRAAWKAKPLSVKIKAYLVLAFFGSPAVLAILVGLMAMVVPQPLAQLAAWAEPVTGVMVGLVHQPVVKMPPSSFGQPADAGQQADTGGIFLSYGQPASTLFALPEWLNRRDVIPTDRRDVDDLVIAGDMAAVSLVMSCTILILILMFARRRRSPQKALPIPFTNPGMNRSEKARSIEKGGWIGVFLLCVGGYCLYDAFYTGNLFWSAELTRHGNLYSLGTFLIRTGRLMFGANLMTAFGLIFLVFALKGNSDFKRDLAAKPATD